MTIDNTTQAWQQEIAATADLKSRVEQLSMELETAKLNVSYYSGESERRRTAHEADIALIGETLISEANDRDWCGEYDQIVDSLNLRLNEMLPNRVSDHDFSFTITFRVTTAGRDEEHASEEAWEFARAVERRVDNADGTDGDCTLEMDY